MYTCIFVSNESLLLTVALWSLTLMIGSFFLKSHTTQRPQGEAEAKMCCTCLFHATQLMLSGGKVLLPGVRGLLGFVKSQIYISESLAPDANRLVLNGLKSSAWTGPCKESRTNAFASEYALKSRNKFFITSFQKK